MLPQAVELRLLPAELDQQQGQLLGLHRATHRGEKKSCHTDDINNTRPLVEIKRDGMTLMTLNKRGTTSTAD